MENPPAACSSCQQPQQHHDGGDAACGLIFDAAMQQLHMREGHLEHPARVHALNEQLLVQGLHARCTQLSPRQATDEELLRCHSRAHIDKVDSLHSDALNADDGEPASFGDAVVISGDIYVTRHSSAAARSAAGCSIQAVESVLAGTVQRAFALVRPPGHHATSDELMGFCFYNNVAVAAAAALEHPGMERVLILDWDVHHGNGTQQIFYKDPRVLVVSLHRRDPGYYPAYCGAADEAGAGAGIGFNINVPWSSKGMGDADYLAALDLLLAPVLHQFSPQLVLVSAGFDAADGDVLGRCHVSPAGFAAMTARLLDWCAQSAAGRLVAVLEGGYVPSIVADCTCQVVRVLLGEQPPPLPPAAPLHKSTRSALSKVDAIHRQHWSQLAQQPPFAARFQAYSTALQLQRLSITAHAPAGHGTRAAVRAAAAAAGAGAPLGSAAAGAAGTSSSSGSGGGRGCGRSKPLASCAPPLRGRSSSSSRIASGQRRAGSMLQPAAAVSASQPPGTSSGAAPGPILQGMAADSNAAAGAGMQGAAAASDEAPGPVQQGAAASSGAAAPGPVQQGAAASSGARPGGLKIRIKLKKPGAVPAAPSASAVPPAAVQAAAVPPAVPPAPAAASMAALAMAPACRSIADVMRPASAEQPASAAAAASTAAQAAPPAHTACILPAAALADAAAQVQKDPTALPGRAAGDGAAQLAELLIGLSLAGQGSQRHASATCGTAGAAAAIPASSVPAAATPAAAAAGGSCNASAAAKQPGQQSMEEQVRVWPASNGAAAATGPWPVPAPAKQQHLQPLELGTIRSELLVAAAVRLPDDDA